MDHDSVKTSPTSSKSRRARWGAAGGIGAVAGALVMTGMLPVAQEAYAVPPSATSSPHFATVQGKPLMTTGGAGGLQHNGTGSQNGAAANPLVKTTAPSKTATKTPNKTTPNKTKPGNSGSDNTKPGNSKPGSSGSDSSKPDNSKPGSSGADDSSKPGNSKPGSSGSDSVKPTGVAKPDGSGQGCCAFPKPSPCCGKPEETQKPTEKPTESEHNKEHEKGNEKEHEKGKEKEKENENEEEEHENEEEHERERERQQETRVVTTTVSQVTRVPVAQVPSVPSRLAVTGTSAPVGPLMALGFLFLVLGGLLLTTVYHRVRRLRRS